ncbi:MAG: cytochrome c [Deltaproteobacteria bacterium]|nr:cytochrome c [Deltaproteobacteria bacterium]
MSNILQKGLRLALVTALVSLPISLAIAHDDGAITQYREMLMRGQGANTGMIGGILAGKLPFQNHIATHARALENSARLIPEAFEKNTSTDKAKTHPKIWKNWKEFTIAALALEQASARLAEIAQSGDQAAVAAQVKKLGAACGSCHEVFR